MDVELGQKLGAQLLVLLLLALLATLPKSGPFVASTICAQADAVPVSFAASDSTSTGAAPL